MEGVSKAKVTRGFTVVEPDGAEDVLLEIRTGARLLTDVPADMVVDALNALVARCHVATEGRVEKVVSRLAFGEQREVLEREMLAVVAEYARITQRAPVDQHTLGSIATSATVALVGSLLCGSDVESHVLAAVLAGLTASRQAAADSDEVVETVQTLEAELEAISPLSERGLAAIEQLAGLAPSSQYAFARAHRWFVTVVQAESELLGTQARRSWRIAAEVVALAEGDSRLANRSVDEALAEGLARSTPIELVRRAWFLLRLERWRDAELLINRVRDVDECLGAAADTLDAYLLLHVGPVGEAFARAQRAINQPSPFGAEFAPALAMRAALRVGDLRCATGIFESTAAGGSDLTLGSVQLQLARGMVALATRSPNSVELLSSVQYRLRQLGVTNPAGWPWMRPLALAHLGQRQPARANEIVAEARDAHLRWATPVVLAELHRATTALASSDAVRDRARADARMALAGSPADAVRAELEDECSARGGSKPLTPREREIAGCVTEGRTAQQIADELQISKHTVNNHLKAIYAKTGYRDRTALAVGYRP